MGKGENAGWHHADLHAQHNFGQNTFAPELRRPRLPETSLLCLKVDSNVLIGLSGCPRKEAEALPGMMMTELQLLAQMKAS